MNREEKSRADWTNRYISKQINREEKQRLPVSNLQKKSLWSNHAMAVNSTVLGLLLTFSSGFLWLIVFSF